ncbi:iron ABC transporter permease [Kocuria dechangensis]|uniref:Iron ABC transporter permease n=1 Tax=Kocuria dechangensis TaxID=1176249 RepID=A0A917GL96_9MICC|nr:iron ABC transporter permease [Kocuria dechangensis]GGG49669.1 iron ABC transporter permease [Kocuria dechangensis]
MAHSLAIPPARSSTRHHERARWLLLSLVVSLGAVALSVCVGGRPSTLAEAWHALATPTGTVMDVTIRELRWPRTVTAVVAGVCLGVAGVLVQGHTRNPIADPGLLGINQGAGLAIVAATALAGAVAPLTQALLAFAGALVAVVVVFLIGSASRHGATPITLVLAGAAVSALCTGLVSGIVLLDDQALDTLRFWQVGSVAVRNGSLEILGPFLAVGLMLAVLNVGALNALSLGEDTARSLGVSVVGARATGIAAITLLAGAAVTLAGPIAFAGLLVPHIARAMVGADYRWLIPAVALTGAALLLLADTAGRVVARPGELSVGVVLAAAGAPFFVHLARRKKLVTV